MSTRGLFAAGTLSAFIASNFLLSASAQTPALINYQGRLVSGTNLVNGNVGLSLRLFDASSGGTKLYEDSNTVTVADGLYATFIGDNGNFGTLPAALETTDLWVEVAVNGTALSPREPVVSVAGALRVAGLLIRADGSAIVRPDANTVATSAVASAIGGGSANLIYFDSSFATIAGGRDNDIGTNAVDTVIGGGRDNNIGDNSLHATIAGGQFNDIAANAGRSTIGGGFNNNVADNSPYAVIPGGRDNDIGPGAAHAFAAGRQAKAYHPGVFIWADDTGVDFTSATSNQFLIRASGGVGIGTSVTTGAALTVAGGARFSGAVTAASFSGTGSGLTGLNGGQLADGTVSNADLAVGAVTSATVQDGSLTGTDIANGSISNADLAAGAVTTTTVLDGTLTGTDISDGTISVADVAGNSFWNAGGNVGTTPATHYLGTGDNQPIEIRVNGARAARFVPATPAPNILFGTAANSISNGVSGASVLGGISNAVIGGASNAVVAGGVANWIGSNAWASTISGGAGNRIQADAGGATIGGGNDLTIGSNCDYAVISGGQDSSILTGAFHSAIGGGSNNRIGQSPYSMIGGGAANVVNGGQRNAIVGGIGNSIGSNASESIVGGGYDNRIYADRAVIAGGVGNQAQDGCAAIGGGSGNAILSSGPPFYAGYSVIAGGTDHTIGLYADSSVIGGGNSNTIGSFSRGSAILGGEFNAVKDSAENGTILGGQYNEIWSGATNSTVGGTRAIAFNPGCFVWADSQAGSFGSTASDQAAFRCKGGVVFSSGSTGVNQRVSWVPGNASWSFVSDRNTKEAIEAVDVQAVLDKVSRVPISEWQYKGYAQRHIGPMAQDFHAAFPLNDDDRVLNDADLHGVALAAIQALNAEVGRLKAEGGRQKAENEELKKQLDDVLHRLRALEEK